MEAIFFAVDFIEQKTTWTLVIVMTRFGDWREK